jgi:hypothetical protein
MSTKIISPTSVTMPISLACPELTVNVDDWDNLTEVVAMSTPPVIGSVRSSSSPVIGQFFVQSYNVQGKIGSNPIYNITSKGVIDNKPVYEQCGADTVRRIPQMYTTRYYDQYATPPAARHLSAATKIEIGVQSRP